MRRVMLGVLLAAASAGHLLTVATVVPALAAQQESPGQLTATLLLRSGMDGRFLVSSMQGASVTHTELMPPFGEQGWRVAGEGDFDGDLLSDILWRRDTDSRTAVALMQAGRVIRLAPGPVLDGVGWRVAGTGDFNGDRKDDVLWRNVAGGNPLVWLMDGTAVAGQARLGPYGEAGWDVEAVGDFDGDAAADVLWRRSSDGRAVVWLMQGLRVHSSVQLPTVAGPEWQFSGTGDFNGDLRTDVLWRDRGAGTLAWLMRGAEATAVPLSPSPGGQAWQVAGVVDVNGDRAADLVWVNTVDGAYQVSVTDRANVAAPAARVRVAGAGGRPVPLAVDAADILEGATNYRSSYPRPGAVTFVTRDGRQIQVNAFPGMVQVFAEPRSDQAVVEAGIGRFRGLILSKVPLLGYYLVGVDSGSEATFIAGIRGTSGVLDAMPNMAVGLRQAAVPIGDTYFTDPRPVPLNVGPGVVVIDQDFDLRGHGSQARQTVLNGGASVGGLVNLAVQCIGCNGRTSAHHIGLIIAAAAQGNSVFNPGTPMVANVSFGPDIYDASGATLVAEQVTPDVVTANQRDNETFLRSLLSVTRQIPAAHEHTVTFATGNSHVDLTSALANLRADAGLAAELEDHYLLAGTGLASNTGVVFSNYVQGRDLDVVTSNNLEAMDGTSFAAPGVAAILDVVRVRTGVSRDIALLAVKLIDEPDGQVAVDRAVEMALAIRDAIPRIMAEAGVTRAQALVAIRGAVRNHATGAFVLDEAIEVARRLASRVIATPASLTFTGTRGQANPAPQAVTIASTGVALQWRATSGASWLSASPATGRTASPVTVSASTSGLAAGTYSASLTLNAVETGESVQVPVTLTVREDCTYTLSRTGVSVAAAGASGLTVGVTASSGCAWTATESSSFLSITGGSSGTGSGTVTFTVSANTGAARSGTLTVAGQAVTVSQSAGTTTDGLGAWTFRGSGCDRSADPLPGWLNCRGTITVTIAQVNQSGFVSVFMAYPDSGSFYHGQVAVTAGRAPGTVSITVVNNYVPRCVSSYATTISAYDGTQSAGSPPLIGRSTGTLTFSCS